MKKIISLLIIFLLAITLLGCSTQSEQFNQANVLEDIRPLEIMRELEKYPSRVTGEDSEDSNNLISYIDSIFDTLDILPYGDEVKLEDGSSVVSNKQAFTFSNPLANKKTESTYNLRYIKKSKSLNPKKIILTAGFDNVYTITNPTTTKPCGGSGAYFSNSGITGLIATAKQLQTYELEFDVEFAFLNGTAQGYFGSEALYKVQDSSKILSVINFDSISGGDNLYMYSEDYSTEHNNFFYEIAKENEMFISKVPNFKKGMLAEDKFGNGYYHYGKDSNAEQFNVNKINTINFLSMNWQNPLDFNRTEIEDKENVLFTEADTLATMITRFGGDSIGEIQVEKRINSAVTIVVKAVTNNEFIAKMESSAKSPDLSVLSSAKLVKILSISSVVFILGIAIIYVICVTGMKKRVVNPFNPTHTDNPLNGASQNKNNQQSSKLNQTKKDFEDVFGETGSGDVKKTNELEETNISKNATAEFDNIFEKRDFDDVFKD